MVRALLLSLVLALSVFWPAESGAVPITFKFKGTVTSTFFDPFDPFGGSIGFGTPFVGTYTFHSMTADAIPDPGVGSYSMFGAPFGMTVGIGGSTFKADDFLNVGVANDIGVGADQYSVLAQKGIPFLDPESLTIQLFLEDPAGAALSGDALPLKPPGLEDFLVSDFFLDGVRTLGGDIFQFQVQGTLTALAVPEPCSLSLLGVGLLALLAFGWQSLRGVRP